MLCRRLTALLILQLTLVLACGGGGGGSSAPPPPQPPPTVTGKDVLLNGGFETGAGDYWTVAGALVSDKGITPHGGRQHAWLGGWGTSRSDLLSTEVGVPADATQATLLFWMNIKSNETGSSAVDTCSVKAYDVSTGTFLGTLRTFSNLDKTSTWTWFTLDLLPHTGKVLRLEWVSNENASVATAWFLDDVSMLVQGPFENPAIVGVTPTTGFAGEDTIDVLATHAYDANQLSVNGIPCTGFTLVNGARTRGMLAASASSGPVTVQTPRGLASGPNVTVQYPTPVLSRFNPTRAPVGAKVILEGQRLGSVNALTLNGSNVPSFTVDSPTQITLTVPSGATTGRFKAFTPGNVSGTSTSNFTVTNSGPLTDYWIDRMHLNQATQNLAGDVPAVANRDACLRVFLRANVAGLTVPAVRVTLTPSGGAPEELTGIDLPSSSVPTDIGLGDLDTSVNVLIPANKMAPGVTLSATVDPGSLITEADESNNQMSLAPLVKNLTPFRTTIIPVRQGGTTGNATVDNLSEWVSRLKAMFPVATAVDVELGPIWVYGGPAVQADGTGWMELLAALDKKRVAENSTRYYYGALNITYSSGVAGLGYIPSAGVPDGRSALGWDEKNLPDGENFYDVYAHETGHNLGQYHSPCGGAGGPDPNYPYAEGGIGTWGLEVGGSPALKAPGIFKDIMGYCSPNWISDYVFKNILTHREGTPQPLVAGSMATQPCLIVSAMETENGFELGTALEVPTMPTHGQGLEGFRLQGLDLKGVELFSIPMEVAVIGCGPAAGRRHLIAAVPVSPAMMAQLQQLRLSEAGAVRAMRQAVAPSMLRRVAEAPQARRVGPGEVALRWDAVAYPTAWLRNPVTGEIVATLQGGEAILPDLDAGWELRLSDGLKTVVQPVPILR